MNKRRAIWLGLFILSLTGITAFGGIGAYCLFFSTLFVLFISVLYVIYIYFRFLIYQEIETRNIVCGQPVKYSFVLQNADIVVYSSIQVRMYDNYSTVEQIMDEKIFTLYPGDRQEFNTRLTCKYRGDYPVGVSEVIVTDFLGLVRIRYNIPSKLSVLVTPKIVYLNEIKSISQAMSSTDNYRSREIPEADIIARNYVQGDPLNRIHWKASARTGNLMTRTDTGSGRRKISILCDFQRISEDLKLRLPSENKILETIIALLQYFTSHNVPAVLFYKIKEFQSSNIERIEDFTGIYQLLSKLFFEKDNDFGQVIEEYQNRRFTADAGITIWVVHELTESMYCNACTQTEEGRSIIIYLISDQEPRDYFKSTNPKLQVILVGTEQELWEVL